MEHRVTEDEIKQDTVAEGASHGSSAVPAAHDQAANGDRGPSFNTALPDPSSTHAPEGEDSSQLVDEEASEVEDDQRAWIYIRDRMLAEIQARNQTSFENPAHDTNHPLWDPNSHIWRRTAIALSRWWGVRVTPLEIFLRFIPFALGELPLPEGLFIDAENGHLTAVPPNTTTTPAQAREQPEGSWSESEGENDNAESEHEDPIADAYSLEGAHDNSNVQHEDSEHPDSS